MILLYYALRIIVIVFHLIYLLHIHCLIIILGATEDPEKTSTRIAFLTTFVGGLLLYSSYSASLTSFLAIVQVAYPFVDLHSLYYQSDFKIGSVGGTVMDNYFAVSSELLNFMHQLSRWRKVGCKK